MKPKKRPYVKQPRLMRGAMTMVSNRPRGEEAAVTYRIGMPKEKALKFGRFKIRLPSTRNYYVRPYETEMVNEILNGLRKAGLNVEEPGSASRKTVTVSKHMGRPLPAAIRWLPEKRKNRLILDTFELLGKIHAQGVKHGHPHVENIVVGKGKVGFIDFRMAKKVNVDWNNAQDVAGKFWRDYAFIGGSNLKGGGQGRVIPTVKMSPRLMGEGFKLLVSQYPCSDAVKAIVFRAITGLLVRHSVATSVDEWMLRLAK